MKFGETLRVGLLGASKIAPEAILKPAQAVPRVQVVGVAARDSARAKAYAAEHRIPHWFGSYDELIQSPEVDLVYCALPVSHHAVWSIKALDAGKHVLCEKPFAMNLAEARRMVEAGQRNQRRIIEAFHYSHHPAFAVCQGWIQSGLVGPIREAQASFSTRIPIDGVEIRSIAALGGGAMMDLGCYPLHWLESLLGEPAASVKSEATLTTTGVDEKMRAQLEFNGGAIAEISTDMGPSAKLEAKLELHGELGRIHFINPLAPHFGASLTAELHDGSVQHAPISSLSTYAYQLGDVVDALLNDMPLANEGERVLQQQMSLDAIYEAADLAQLRVTTQTK